VAVILRYSTPAFTSDESVAAVTESEVTISRSKFTPLLKFML
jgi:hypothetical protein